MTLDDFVNAPGDEPPVETDTRTPANREYRIGDAVDELAALPDGSARVIHLDDAWARPKRCGGHGVEYETRALDVSFEIVDKCWDVLEDGGWLVADADDWFKKKLEDHLCETH